MSCRHRLSKREENHTSVEQKTGAQGSAADPTPDDRLVEVVEDIVGQLVRQNRDGIQAQQGKFVILLIEIVVQLKAAATVPAARAAGGKGAAVIVEAVPRRGGGSR